MSELHYLRIVTTQGETLQLYNLQNAIDELKDLYDGLQTHRSYWVNKAHVDKIIGKASDRKILTKQGHLIPISRRQYTAVKSRLA
jgi:DNA-binding LytR/AlgR family response regulator